ncbi:MAG: TolC family protein [Desulfobulbus sp.]|jgi:outer membrane protein TolC|uniref:TolC family protein n=1 Tax=Desulfobulbus sp. TaxID=895 RepID=UPI0028441288|nr:TolC family protein [Desulfobulbus sp.]MDR2551015.1 TolC family protein [Desulfobulbus sp.]
MRVFFRLVPAFLLLGLFMGPGIAARAGDRQTQGEEQLEALVNRAATGNPEILVSEEQWRMSVARARQAGVLDDPMLMLGVQNALIRDPFNFSRDAMTSKVVGISQKVPFFGKRDLMREEAGLESEVERWAVEERRLELRRLVKETWYQIYLIDRSLETVRTSATLLDDLVRQAESMYTVGKAGQQEVFQAQLERSKMEELRLGLEQRRASSAAALNALVSRPPDTALSPIAPIKLRSRPLVAAELERLAESQRPALKALQAKIDKGRAGERLARKEFYPDFTVSLEYMQREPVDDMRGDDMYAAQLSFNLPVQQEWRRAKAAEMQASIRMAIQERAALHNQIGKTIADGLAQLERSRKLAQLYEQGMLAQAGGAAEAAMAGYRTGKATFAEVLAGRVNLFNAEREYHGAVAEHQIQLAVLENVIGGPLPPPR